MHRKFQSVARLFPAEKNEETGSNTKSKFLKHFLCHCSKKTLSKNDNGYQTPDHLGIQ